MILVGIGLTVLFVFLKNSPDPRAQARFSGMNAFAAVIGAYAFVFGTLILANRIIASGQSALEKGRHDIRKIGEGLKVFYWSIAVIGFLIALFS